MTLAPHHVPWALSACALLLLALSLCWMILHDATMRIMSRLKLSDGIALWLLFSAAYHSFARYTAPPLAITEDPAALWILWGGCAVYLTARLAPGAMRKEAVFMAVALAVWAWSIGAGYQFLAETEVRADTLEFRPGSVFAENTPRLEPLQGALKLSRLKEEPMREVAGLLRGIESGKRISAARKAAVRQVLFPEILAHYRRELRRLNTYQALQIVLLAAVLLAWGFGRKMDD